MKNEISTVAFLLLLLLGFMFLPTSCTRGADRDRFGFAQRDSMAKVEGKIDGKEISATVFNFPSADGEEIRASVLFHSPASLEGINVTMLACGECSARLGETAVNTKGLDGLIEPFIPLISPAEIYSIRRSNGFEEVRICDENCDLTYVFEEGSDIPMRVFGKYFGRNIDMQIKCFSFDFVLPK